MGQQPLSDSPEIAQSDLTRPAGHNMLAALLFSVVLGGAGGRAQAQGVDIEVLSHICKYGVHSDGRRYSQSDNHQSVTIAPRVL